MSKLEELGFGKLGRMIADQIHAESKIDGITRLTMTHMKANPQVSTSDALVWAGKEQVRQRTEQYAELEERYKTKQQ